MISLGKTTFWDAQWIHQPLPSCHLGFEPQAHHLCLRHLYLNLCCNLSLHCKKRPGLAHILWQSEI